MYITCVHQGYELYGSDRSFLETVATIRKTYPKATIDVVLPKFGPIVPLLEDVATRVIIEPLWVLRRRDLARLMTLGVARLPFALARAVRRLAASDLVYVNTSVVADYLLAARLFPGKTVVHVHEIPSGLPMKVLRRLLAWSRAEIIFNSKASQGAFALSPGPSATVIYNGVPAPLTASVHDYDGTRPLRLLMLGRISRIKGQEVLVEALRQLPAAVRSRLDVRLVGSAFEDDQRERDLASHIEAAGLRETVTLSPFTPDTAPLYRWADLVAVPSQLPESLGRVAIEAMAFGRPAVASRIGGLCEIVEDGRTGWLVPPGEAAPLAGIIRRAVENPAAWSGFGRAGRARYEAVFSEASAHTALANLFNAKLGLKRGRVSPERPLGPQTVTDGAS